MFDKDDELERMRMARIPRPKPEKKRMRTMSEKKRAQLEEERKLASGDADELKERWFRACRIVMTGVCQCGCGEPSQKNDNARFRASAAHIFPKSLFPSIMYHPLNWVERRVWAKCSGDFNSCHAIMDEGGLARWPFMADWDDIKAKFFLLAPLLTPEEKERKFYILLEKLVYEN